MELIAIALNIFLLIVPSYQLPTTALNDISVPPLNQVNTQKPDLPTKDLNNLIQQKLTQHGQVLEEILMKYEKNEELLRKMVDHFTLRLNESKKIDKVELFLPNRRSSVAEINTTSTTEIPKKDPSVVSIVRFGMNIRRYGKLFGDIISNEIKNQLQPILEVISLTENTRRSSQDVLKLPEKGKANQWCSIANLCKDTTSSNPVCGLDKNYGLSTKFDSICHMLQTNCYWGYDFTLVSSCELNKI